MENFKYNNKSFIMPMSAFDPFRTSWFECSSCRNPLFEKQIMSKIPHICPHCGVYLENIICDEQVFHILYKTGKIVNVNKEFTRNEWITDSHAVHSSYGSGIWVAARHLRLSNLKIKLSATCRGRSRGRYHIISICQLLFWDIQFAELCFQVPYCHN